MDEASPANVLDFVFGHGLELVVARMDGRADIVGMPPAEVIERHSTRNCKTRIKNGNHHDFSEFAHFYGRGDSDGMPIHRFSLKHKSSH